MLIIKSIKISVFTTDHNKIGILISWKKKATSQRHLSNLGTTFYGALGKYKWDTLLGGSTSLHLQMAENSDVILGVKLQQHGRR